MAQYGQADVSFTVGGTEMKAYIQNFGDFDVEALMEEIDTLGDNVVKNGYVGVKRIPPFDVDGYYDDTATTGSNAKFNAVGTIVAVVITWGGTKTSTLNCVITKFRRKVSRGKKTRFVATLIHSTGGIAEA